MMVSLRKIQRNVSRLNMEKIKTLSRNKNAAVKRGPNEPYIPHQLPPKPPESQLQKVELQDDEFKAIVPPLTREKKTFTPSEIDARFRAAIAKEPVPAPIASVEIEPKRVHKPKKRLIQAINIRRSQKDPWKSIQPRLPVKIVRAANTTGILAQYLVPKSKPIPAKPKEPEVIPESEAESVSEDGTSPTSTEPKSTPIQESEAESIEKSAEKIAAESESEKDEVFLPNPPTQIGETVGAEPDPNSPPANHLQCEICGRILNSKSSKSMHKRTHNPTKFPCPAPGCKRSYGSKFTLQRHQAKFHR